MCVWAWQPAASRWPNITHNFCSYSLPDTKISRPNGKSWLKIRSSTRAWKLKFGKTRMHWKYLYVHKYGVSWCCMQQQVAISQTCLVISIVDYALALHICSLWHDKHSQSVQLNGEGREGNPMRGQQKNVAKTQSPDSWKLTAAANASATPILQQKYSWQCCCNFNCCCWCGCCCCCCCCCRPWFSDCNAQDFNATVFGLPRRCIWLSCSKEADLDLEMQLKLELKSWSRSRSWSWCWCWRQQLLCCCQLLAFPVSNTLKRPFQCLPEVCFAWLGLHFPACVLCSVCLPSFLSPTSYSLILALSLSLSLSMKSELNIGRRR